MANTYYEHDNPFIAGTLVASAGVNAQLDLIETGFEAVQTTFTTRIQFPDTFSGNHKIPSQSVNNKLLYINSSGDADLYSLSDIDTAVAAAAASATAAAASAVTSATEATASLGHSVTSYTAGLTSVNAKNDSVSSATASATSATASAASATAAAASATAAANSNSAATTNNVLKTADQTIAGTKTFSAQIVGSFTTSAQTEADIVTAQTRADLGVTNAQTAQTRADLGVTNAQTAQTRADLGVTNAATAQTRADLGVTNAAAAATSANSAVIAAATAQSTANTGVTNAATAQTKANAALARTGGTMTGLIVGRNCATTTITGANDTGSISFRGSATTVAAMSFHRINAYGVNFGLSTANKMELGGFSAGAIKHTWDMAGNYTATGNITAYSDIRLKDNIELIPDAIAKVKALRGVTFDRNDFIPDAETGVMPDTRQAGVIAQEVEKVLPEVVATNPSDGIKTVAYGNMIGLLIEAIKEQQVQIDELKAAK